MTDRRQILQVGVLTAAGVLVLPGCSSDDTPESPPSAVPDDQQADELALVQAYDAAIAGGVRNIGVVRRIRDEHAEHLRALGWESVGTPSPDESPGIAALLRAERRASRMRADAARDTDDIEQAQILALIAASESQHVVTLEDL